MKKKHRIIPKNDAAAQDEKMDVGFERTIAQTIEGLSLLEQHTAVSAPPLSILEQQIIHHHKKIRSNFHRDLFLFLLVAITVITASIVIYMKFPATLLFIQLLALTVIPALFALKSRKQVNT